MNAHTLQITELYEVEHSRLRSFVRRLIGNPVMAEDLVQQAFANILAKHGQAGTMSAAYARKAVRNLALNHLRDARRRAEIEVPGVEFDQIADAAPSPELVTLYRDELRRLLEAILRLPVRRREAFVLNRIEGLSYDEIAAQMNISRNTVISHVVAAMLELDRQLS
ncbi:RNA polymerase sigma factor [Phyllobacterium sp. 0TCS1.6C]|uniref:RNA polymerase sigma factor n=1 Tax=unclassified Phyllobacterium TaxID=2638441 RepID=UPI00226442BB|nr:MULTISPECIES: RNA polymerase sigma factor [unclassified Phyllobacterium]MCX8281912.1 RNA polymerase sigma factor [Phyllobacterium sp. 0TCS1.6C]MCX8295447.1 RNA polymerase sigma factor [Phyllobacterium sp. 0TCS1.6A]